MYFLVFTVILSEFHEKKSPLTGVYGSNILNDLSETK